MREKYNTADRETRKEIKKKNAVTYDATKNSRACSRKMKITLGCAIILITYGNIVGLVIVPVT